MRFRSAFSLATAGAAAVLVATVAGCGGSAGSNAHASATTAENQVVPVVRALYQRIYDSHVGWSTALSGQYEQCLTNSNHSELDFHGIVYDLYPRSSSVTSAAYLQDVVNAAKADGWTFKKNIQGSRDGNIFPYQMEKGPLDGHISVSSTPGRTGSYRFSALIEVESTCFDAGSDASSLSRHSSQFTLPHPSPLPSP
ncbi:MAG TPA: hypothetical protein VGI31_09625 [Streptosporangiaceae bacterium]